MQCKSIRSLLDAYVDREIDGSTQARIDQHLSDCAYCTRILENKRIIHLAFSNPGLYRQAPPQLRQALNAQIRAKQKPRKWLRIGALAATLAVATLTSWNISWHLAIRNMQIHSSDEAVASHVRSLQATHLTDVASTDQHTVKPWFATRLDFSPTVVDLRAQGFELVGGRLDYLLNRPVAAIVYKRHQHVINLFVYPAANTEKYPQDPLQQSSPQGFNIIRWRHDNKQFTAVSDLNAPELLHFMRHLRKEN